MLEKGQNLWKEGKTFAQGKEIKENYLSFVFLAVVLCIWEFDIFIGKIMIKREGTSNESKFSL